MTKEVVTRTGTLRMGEDGIARVHVFPGARMNAEDTVENLATIEEFNLTEPCPLLVDIRDMAYIDREGRALFEKAIGVSAVGLLIGSPISKVIGSFFIGLNKTVTPTKLFTSESEALQWLKSFLP